MDLAEIIAAARDALKADQVLTQWCQQKYGKQYKVFVGIDEETPPAEADYPLIAIIPAGHDWGIQSRIETNWLVLICGVVQNQVVTTGNVVELVGISEVESFRRLAEERLFKAKILPAESRAESRSGYFFPVFMSGTALRIENRLSSGGPTVR